MKDGWHKIAGIQCYVKDGMVIRPEWGSLYRWDNTIHAYNNLLPCKPERIRYYSKKENLHHM